MTLMEPVRNVWGLLTKASEGAESFLDIVNSEGLTGVLRSLLRLDLAGLKGQVDESLGSGIIKLLVDGDNASVETALRFRKYVMGFLEEFEELVGMIDRFESDELPAIQEATGEMKAFMVEKGPEFRRSRRDRDRDTEVLRLRKALEEIARLAGKDEK